MKSLEAESNIIGQLLSGNTNILEDIKLDYFTEEKYRAIVKAVMTLESKRIGVDLTTMMLQLKTDGANVYHSDVLDIISNTLPVDIEGNIKLLTDLYKRRRTIEILTDEVKNIRNLDQNIDDVNTLLASRIDNVTFNDTDVDDDIDSIIKRLHEDLRSAADVNELDQYSYGLKQLDNMTWGLHKEELTTIAAKSGVGKTAFALQVATRLLSKGLKVLIISREMSDVQIIKRLLVTQTRIDSNKFRSRGFTQTEWEMIKNVTNYYKQNYKLSVNTQATTVTEIKKRIRKIKPDVVIIDYLQLLSSEKSENNREREVAKISRDIKAMTSDFKIPIIQLSQLNDEFGDTRPKGERAMRESKAIYQNSNNVIYIHQPNEKELRFNIKTCSAFDDFAIWIIFIVWCKVE